MHLISIFVAFLFLNAGACTTWFVPIAYYLSQSVVATEEGLKRRPTSWEEVELTPLGGIRDVNAPTFSSSVPVNAGPGIMRRSHEHTVYTSTLEHSAQTSTRPHVVPRSKLHPSDSQLERLQLVYFGHQSPHTPTTKRTQEGQEESLHKHGTFSQESLKNPNGHKVPMDFMFTHGVQAGRLGNEGRHAQHKSTDAGTSVDSHASKRLAESQLHSKIVKATHEMSAVDIVHRLVGGELLASSSPEVALEAEEESFFMIDHGRDGSISEQELEGFLASYGIHCGPGEFLKLFLLTDSDEDGQVSLNEFKKFAKALAQAGPSRSRAESRPTCAKLMPEDSSLLVT